MTYMVKFNLIEINNVDDIQAYDCFGYGLITQDKFVGEEMTLQKFCTHFGKEDIANISYMKDDMGDVIIVDDNSKEPSFIMDMCSGNITSTLNFKDSELFSMRNSYCSIEELHENYGNKFYTITIHNSVFDDFRKWYEGHDLEGRCFGIYDAYSSITK